jgi:hypothetical protein
LDGFIENAKSTGLSEAPYFFKLIMSALYFKSHYKRAYSDELASKEVQAK